MNTARNKSFLYATLIVLALVAVGWVAYSQLVFRAVSMTPDLGKTVATSTDVIEINFNKELQDKNDYLTKNTTDSAKIVSSITVNSKRMLVDLRSLESGEYSIVIKNIVAKNGQNIGELKLDFKAEYVPYNQLSDKEKELQISQTDVNALEDPLDQYLPHSDLGYYLSGGFTDPKNAEQYVLVARITLSKADVSTGRAVVVESQKQKIREFISSKNLDPNDYPISYEIVDPPF